MSITNIVLVLLLLAGITILSLIILNYHRIIFIRSIEGFNTNDKNVKCIKTELNNVCENSGSNMTNKGRLIDNSIGPIKNFHQCFTNNQVAEHKWRQNIEHDMNNLENLNNIFNSQLQFNDNAVSNIYKSVNY